ncbi:MAG: urease subunit beta [Ruminiclostridium sp.]
MIPGEYFIENDYITLNSGRKQLAIKVSNTGDRPVQVGSHFHFFEVNKCLEFDRKESFGRRLDIPSGTAVRFEPGEEKEINLTVFAGDRAIFGLNGLTSGSLKDKEVFEKAIEKAAKFAFKGVDKNEL